MPRRACRRACGLEADPAKHGGLGRETTLSADFYLTRPTNAAIMMAMTLWIHSVVLPIGLSVATTAVLALTVGPRLAARSKRIQAVQDSLINLAIESWTS